MDKLTIRDADVAGKRVFVRVDFNVPARRRQGHRRLAHPRRPARPSRPAPGRGAGHPGQPPRPARRQGQGRPAPAPGRPAPGRAAAPQRAGDRRRAGHRHGGRRQAPARRARSCCSRTCASTPRRRPTTRPSRRPSRRYADVYVNDAFGTAHRAHASTVGDRQAPAGLRRPADGARDRRRSRTSSSRPARPFAAILGGAKVCDKIKVIDHLLTKVDMLVLGGGMANTFLLAQGKAIGKSLAEPDRVEDARRILADGREARRPGRPAGRRHRGQGGHPRDRVQDAAGREDPRQLAHRRPRQGQPGPHGRGPGRRQDRVLERPAGRVRDPVVRRTARTPSRGCWPSAPRPARRSWSAAATRWRPSPSRAWPTG